MTVIDDLGKMCDTAQTCDARARTAIHRVLIKTFSTDEWCANQQARVLRRDIDLMFGRVEEALRVLNGIRDPFDLLERIKAAVDGRTQPFLVAGTMYTTAHEAAEGHAEAALLAWDSFEGENDREKCEDLQRRLQGIKCPDLYHQIEWEYSNALEGLEPPSGEVVTNVGVSLLDAALILNDGDDELAKEKKAAWHRTRKPKKPESIGKCPNHGSVKLYAPSAICDYVEKIEGKSLCKTYSLRKALLGKARPPQGE